MITMSVEDLKRTRLGERRIMIMLIISVILFSIVFFVSVYNVVYQNASFIFSRCVWKVKTVVSKFDSPPQNEQDALSKVRNLKGFSDLSNIDVKETRENFYEIDIKSSEGKIVGKYAIDEYGNLFCYEYECMDPERCGWKESGPVFIFPDPPKDEKEAIEKIKDYKGLYGALEFNVNEPKSGYYIVDVKSPTGEIMEKYGIDKEGKLYIYEYDCTEKEPLDFAGTLTQVSSIFNMTGSK